MIYIFSGVSKVLKIFLTMCMFLVIFDIYIFSLGNTSINNLKQVFNNIQETCFETLLMVLHSHQTETQLAQNLFASIPAQVFLS